ncbi:MAG: VOC family protein [Chloroflexi bacterium]|nr:VOC family protein [Chloroflexota bacterium]
MPDSLPQPRFHHLHLNSVDPTAAVDWYTRVFPVTSPVAWNGLTGLATPDDAYLLFSPVSSPPALSPDTAYWHFGWHVRDAQAELKRLQSRSDVRLCPLYTGHGRESVFISSDTYPAKPGMLGRTATEVAEAVREGIEPRRKGGFAYLQGPDGALVEIAGDFDREWLNHVHMFQEEPWCAQLWYTQHLGATAMARRDVPAAHVSDHSCSVPRGEETTFPSLVAGGTYRTPAAGVAWGNFTLPSYKPQGSARLEPTPGHLLDHIAFAVPDLDAWSAKLRAEGIRLLATPHPLGDTRAFVIEGPSHEAIEIVEA